LFFLLPWPCTKVPHTRLTRVFPDMCMQKQLQGDVEGLHAYMRDLQERIVAPGKSGPTGSKEWLGEGGGGPPPEHLRELLTCLEQYIIAMLRFFEQNMERSMLHCNPPPQ